MKLYHATKNQGVHDGEGYTVKGGGFMDWKRDEKNLDREFTLYCNHIEMNVLTTGIEQLDKAISEGQEIAHRGDLSDMDEESKEEFRTDITEMKEQLKNLWEGI